MWSFVPLFVKFNLASFGPSFQPFYIIKKKIQVILNQESTTKHIKYIYCHPQVREVCFQGFHSFNKCFWRAYYMLGPETTKIGKNGLCSQTILGRQTYKVVSTVLEIYGEY